MAWTSYQILLAAVLVITGSINTLSTKWADLLSSKGSDGIERKFQHPFVQALSMFVGEMLCLVTFKILYYYYKLKDNSQDNRHLTKGSRTFNVFIFFVPAMCDMVATSTMYVGLNLTYPSSFQMFRGSLIVFVALLSVGFLGRKINSREWSGILFVIMGLTVVGVSDFMLMSNSNKHNSVNSILTGDMLIVMAQVITAVQIVTEEYYVSGRDIPPLQACGWEGTFGFLVLGLLQIPFYYIIIGTQFSGNPKGSIEDLPEAFVQMANNPLLILAVSGTIISIAFFNFAGISVTKEISATTRTVLDSVRTIVIWIVTLLLGWQQFSYIQVLGFGLLVIGMCLYNDILVTKLVRVVDNWWSVRRARTSHQTLVNQPADETDP